MNLISLKTELRQELKLTPQLLQSMEVLQMNSQELLDYLGKLSEENPTLAGRGALWNLLGPCGGRSPGAGGDLFVTGQPVCVSLRSVGTETTAEAHAGPV